MRWPQHDVDDDTWKQLWQSASRCESPSWPKQESSGTSHSEGWHARQHYRPGANESFRDGRSACSTSLHSLAAGDLSLSSNKVFCAYFYLQEAA